MSPSTGPSVARGRSARLSFSGLAAEIRPDGFSADGHVLEIGGAEQSHVDLAEPRTVFYEYLRRIATVLDTLAPFGEPITAAHLGAGGMTLPRYLQATRPGSVQAAVEIERELPSFVLSELPLPPGTRLQIVHDDARAALPGLADLLGAGRRAEGGQGIDAVVVDIFSGQDSPAHLADAGFYAECLAELSGRGALVVNVGDDPPLRFFDAQARALADAVEAADLPRAAGPWTLAEASMLSRRHEGNLVLAAGPGLAACGAEDLVAVWEAAGPHPAAVLPPLETLDFVG